jgi:translation initiation factor 3 subunit L
LPLAGCNIALYYYSGFCYLLLRRYLDAARAFNNVLNYIARSAPIPALPPFS